MHQKRQAQSLNSGSVSLYCVQDDQYDEDQNADIYRYDAVHAGQPVAQVRVQRRQIVQKIEIEGGVDKIGTGKKTSGKASCPGGKKGRHGEDVHVSADLCPGWKVLMACPESAYESCRCAVVPGNLGRLRAGAFRPNSSRVRTRYVFLRWLTTPGQNIPPVNSPCASSHRHPDGSPSRFPSPH